MRGFPIPDLSRTHCTTHWKVEEKCIMTFEY